MPITTASTLVITSHKRELVATLMKSAWQHGQESLARWWLVLSRESSSEWSHSRWLHRVGWQQLGYRVFI